MPLTDDDNGRITVNYTNSKNVGGKLSYGTIATYTCDSGFSLNGPQRRVCVGVGDSTMGMFNGSDPTCECMTFDNFTNNLVTMHKQCAILFTKYD